jgi:hypothetical protein
MQSPKLYWWWEGFDNKIQFLTKARNFIVCTTPRLVLGPTMTLFQWGRISFPWGIMTGVWMWPVTSILCQDLGSVQISYHIINGNPHILTIFNYWNVGNIFSEYMEYRKLIFLQHLALSFSFMLIKWNSFCNILLSGTIF